MKSEEELVLKIPSLWHLRVFGETYPQLTTSTPGAGMKLNTSFVFIYRLADPGGRGAGRRITWDTASLTSTLPRLLLVPTPGVETCKTGLGLFFSFIFPPFSY
jgi:hypothetical protein